MTVEETIEALKAMVASKGMIDVGHAAEDYFGLSRTKFVVVLNKLHGEGYSLINILNTRKDDLARVTIKVLGPAGLTYKEAYLNADKIAKVG